MLDFGFDTFSQNIKPYVTTKQRKTIKSIL